MTDVLPLVTNPLHTIGASEEQKTRKYNWAAIFTRLGSSIAESRVGKGITSAAGKTKKAFTNLPGRVREGAVYAYKKTKKNLRLAKERIGELYQSIRKRMVPVGPHYFVGKKDNTYYVMKYTGTHYTSVDRYVLQGTRWNYENGTFEKDNNGSKFYRLYTTTSRQSEDDELYKDIVNSCTISYENNVRHSDILLKFLQSVQNMGQVIEKQDLFKNYILKITKPVKMDLSSGEYRKSVTIQIKHKDYCDERLEFEDFYHKRGSANEASNNEVISDIALCKKAVEDYKNGNHSLNEAIGIIRERFRALYKSYIDSSNTLHYIFNSRDKSKFEAAMPGTPKYNNFIKHFDLCTTTASPEHFQPFINLRVKLEEQDCVYYVPNSLMAERLQKQIELVSNPADTSLKDRIARITAQINDKSFPTGSSSRVANAPPPLK